MEDEQYTGGENGETLEDGAVSNNQGMDVDSNANATATGNETNTSIVTSADKPKEDHEDGELPTRTQRGRVCIYDSFSQYRELFELVYSFG